MSINLILFCLFSYSFCQNLTTTVESTTSVFQNTTICNPNDPRSCNRVGTCSDILNPNNFECICDPDYLGVECEIAKKKQLVAFLLSFFLGTFGAGRFYLGYIMIGIFKIILGFACCFSMFFGICAGFTSSDDGEKFVFIGWVFGALCMCASFLWYIIDFSLIAAGSIDDADGNPLVPW